MRISKYRKKIKINKNFWKWMAGVLAAICVAGGIFFFTFFKVEKVEVLGSSHYSQTEIRDMVLTGIFSGNSVLAPILYSSDHVEGIPFIEGYSVARIDRNTICISVKENKIVGCIPYLDSYIYFDRNGVFLESSRIRDESIPYFDGIEVKRVIKGEKLPIKGTTILNTAVALATIFQKNEMLPDHIRFDENNQIDLLYGDIEVMLGKDEYLEDKMARVVAILPMLTGKKGILHVESVSEHVKTITFEEEIEEITAENWNGGYDEYGNYTGDGEYDENGKHVGPKPMTELDYALEAWEGGYDGEGDYTGYGEYDQYGNYAGPMPTQELMDAKGDWTGGYTENGGYNGYSEFDREGNYVGPNPNEEDYGEDGGYEEYYDDSYDYYEEDYGYDESWE